MEFIKGYYDANNNFIGEGETVKVTTVHGEILEGALVKTAKKEFQLQIQEVIRVLRVDEIEGFELADSEEEYAEIAKVVAKAMSGKFYSEDEVRDIVDLDEEE